MSSMWDETSIYMHTSCLFKKPGSDASELYSAYGEAEVAKVVRLIKTPECHPSVDQDSFADLRPILAVVKKGRWWWQPMETTEGGYFMHSNRACRHYTNAAPFSTLYFVPLRGASHEDEGRLKKLVFKGSTIMDVKCNRRCVEGRVGRGRGQQ